MQEFQYTVKDENGIHARPAGLLAHQAKSYQSSVTMIYGENSADVKRLFALMKLNVKQGDTVTIQVSGADETEAAHELEEFLNKNL